MRMVRWILCLMLAIMQIMAITKVSFAAGIKTEQEYGQIISKLNEEGKTDEALQYAKELVAAYPDNPKAYELMAGLYGKKGELDKTVDTLNRAIELNPNSDSAYYKLGVAYFQKGNEEKAKEAFQEVLEIGDKGESRGVLVGYAKQALQKLQNSPPLVDQSEIFLSVKADKTAITLQEKVELKYYLFTRFDTAWDGLIREGDFQGFAWKKTEVTAGEMKREVDFLNEKKYVKTFLGSIELSPKGIGRFVVSPGAIRVASAKDEDKKNAIMLEAKPIEIIVK